ncbi:hypothetical protein SAMN05444673_0853 [Bacillus sp. OV166]|nr:hypothetical protein SAMN05444673_0853 [Bacillus sp. OV166]
MGRSQFEKPTDVKIHIGSAAFSVIKQAKFAIDSSKSLPQSFEYLGNQIMIKQMEVGNPTKIVMTEELDPKRAYEMLDYRFYEKRRLRIKRGECRWILHR